MRLCMEILKALHANPHTFAYYRNGLSVWPCMVGIVSQPVTNNITNEIQNHKFCLALIATRHAQIHTPT